MESLDFAKGGKVSEIVSFFVGAESGGYVARSADAFGGCDVPDAEKQRAGGSRGQGEPGAVSGQARERSADA